MYHKLARGYATAFIAKQKDQDEIENWFDGERGRRALVSFEYSCLSKKPGRCTKRLAPILRPTFKNPIIGVWSRDLKLVMAEGFAAAPESSVFALAEAELPLYQERSFFLSNLFLSARGENFRADLLTVANISHHAIARLLEREVATPDTLARKVNLILNFARNLAMTYGYADLDHSQPHAFLLPYENGALPVVAMHVRTSREDATERRPVMSVRTFLSSDMLGREHHERMGGFLGAMNQMSEDGGREMFARWIEVNARPWTIMSDASEREISWAVASGA